MQLSRCLFKKNLDRKSFFLYQNYKSSQIGALINTLNMHIIKQRAGRN